MKQEKKRKKEKKKERTNEHRESIWCKYLFNVGKSYPHAGEVHLMFLLFD